jgi:hypothetical protein
MADLNDVVTVQKNGVIAINNLNQTEAVSWLDTSLSPPVPYLKTIGDDLAIIAGITSKNPITSDTFAVNTAIAGSGKLISFSVVVPGTASGLIHDAATVGAQSAANAMALTPTTGGVFIVGEMKFSNGIVIIPGSGQSVNVTYVLD